ncbi:catalase-peroxidase, partial [Pseudoalteromonas sp. S4488]
NKKASGVKEISLADMIVLGGAAAIEKAASDAGFSIAVPFKPGRMEASLEMSDVESFEVLEQTAVAFRNYYRSAWKSPAEMLGERAD